jgi:hypothetical protein
MNTENTKKLFYRFDFFHPETPIDQSLMGFGFEHADGWFDLIWQLCLDIEDALHNLEPDAQMDFRVLQVKEKYGTLRFYANWGTDKIFDLIEDAEEKSARICEICGKEGRINSEGWVTVRCSDCES